MTRTLNVLIDGMGGDVGQGVYKALEKSSLDLNLFGACVSETSSWLHRVERPVILPLIRDPAFPETLIAFLNERKIDAYLPTVDSGIATVAALKDEIEARTDCVVCVGSSERVAICDDKLAAARFAKDAGVDVPFTAIPSEQALEELLKASSFPVVVKPRRGSGSKGVVLARSADDVRPWFGNDDYVLQEYLPDDEGEYTTGVYLGDDGEIKGCCTLRRELKGGATYKAVRMVDETLEMNPKSLAKALGMKYLNVQSRKRNGVLVPFELNGRFSGTTGIISRVFNAPDMFLRERVLRETLGPVANDEIFHVMRYSEEVFATPAEMDELRSKARP